ncbi:unnamed protein product, partial [Symbiodinium sp. KB8]
HVVTYNEAAILLYESCSFLRIEYFPSFYFLHGRHYDSYLYARYLRGSRPPWRPRSQSLVLYSNQSGSVTASSAITSLRVERDRP